MVKYKLKAFVFRNLLYICCMSPTVFHKNGMRFFFFSLEENRMHIHIRQAEKKAKIWIEPSISLAENKGFSSTEISNILKEVQKHERIIREKWNNHRGSNND